MNKWFNWMSLSGGTVMTAWLFVACATLPNKLDLTLGNEQFVYTLQGTGQPTVIFEAGLGGGMDSWVSVYHKVAEFTTAFAYDRRGYGESGKCVDASSHRGTQIAETIGETQLDAVVPGGGTVAALGQSACHTSNEIDCRTGAEVVSELHVLLEKAGVQPPYVLVGHSLGGLYTSLYTRTYPEQVAGMVLLDAMHPEQVERCKQYLPAKECDPEYYPWWVKMLIKMAPDVIRAEMAGVNETGRQIRAAGPLSPVPIVVISHGKPSADENGMDRMWAALQQDLVNESPRAIHIIATKSGHNIQSDEPELVVQAIQDLVLKTR